MTEKKEMACQQGKYSRLGNDMMCWERFEEEIIERCGGPRRDGARSQRWQKGMRLKPQMKVGLKRKKRWKADASSLR